MRKLILSTSFSDPKILDEMHWTHSSQKAFRNCQRKFFWKYIMRLRPKYRDSNLMIGSYFAQWKEAWYTSKKSAESIAEPFRKEMLKEIDTGKEFFDEKEYGKAEAAVACFTGMCMGYAEYYKKDRKKFADILVEESFEIKYDGFVYEGQIDMIYSEKGRLKYMEDKTAKMINTTYIARLELDNQIRGYYVGTKAIMGKAPKVCTYNVVKKSSKRRKSGESQKEFNQRIADDYFLQPEFYFMRIPIRIGRPEVEEFELNIQLTNRDYHTIIDGPDPDNPWMWHANDAACTDFFKLCPFHKLCTGALDVSTEMYYNQGEELHVELRKETEANLESAYRKLGLTKKKKKKGKKK